MQKTIGPDLFAKLIPLSVHESASVYSEEKAKIVRAEVEKAENIENEIRVGLESLGVKTGLGRFKEIAEGTVDAGVPPTVTTWQEEIRRKEQGECVEEFLRRLEGLKSGVKAQLDSVGRDLDMETRECEAMRVSLASTVTIYALSSGISCRSSTGICGRRNHPLAPRSLLDKTSNLIFPHLVQQHHQINKFMRSGAQ